MQRRTYSFSGHVQGVGFRYTAQAIARGYDVSGYVRNLPDGRVEMVVEGAEKEIDAMAAELHRRMEDFVKRVDTDTSPATGEYKDFSIRH